MSWRFASAKDAKSTGILPDLRPEPKKQVVKTVTRMCAECGRQFSKTANGAGPTRYCGDCHVIVNARNCLRGWQRTIDRELASRLPDDWHIGACSCD